MINWQYKSEYDIIWGRHIKISECTLSKETQDLLYRYFAAAANLYGVIEIGKLLKIYNSQNEPVSEEDFLSFVEIMNFKGKYFCVFNQDDIYDDGSETPALEQEILAEYLYFFEFDDDSLDKDEMLKYRQIGKKFCVLDKEQFLRYEDDCYFKKTPDFLEMRSFLRNKTGLSKEDADDYANDIMICFSTQPDNSKESVYEVILGSGIYNRDDIAFSHRKLEYLCQKVMYTSARLHVLLRHTPEEIFG